MKFIRGKYEKCLRTHENIRDYKYNENDYFLQHERNFAVILYQVVFDNDFIDEDITDLSKNEYLTIKKIASFNENDAKNLSCKDMKRYIAIKHTIEDIEKDNFVNFNLIKEEREKINYLLLRLNKDDFIEEVFSFYNIEDRNQVIVKKEDFKDYELELLLDNDFDNYFCYSDTNYDYLLIERKGEF